MILSGTVTAVAAVTTLVSGTVFKRAFDAYHQHVQSPPAAAATASSNKVVEGTPANSAGRTDVKVGTVKSVDKKRGRDRRICWIG
jgi:hypothetical protein